MASTMSSSMEYRQLLKGLDRQNRAPPLPPPPVKIPPRKRGRARAVYPGNNRTRSMEPLGSIDEIVMDSDFSDSAISPPPPSQRHRRPSTPRNFSRPDPVNFSPRLSRDQDRSSTTSSNETIKVPIRGGEPNNAAKNPPRSSVQAMSAFHAGDPLPDEPTFDDDLDSEDDRIYGAPRRPQVYSNQRYEPRPGSAKASTSASLTRSPIAAPAQSAWDNVIHNGASNSHLPGSKSSGRSASRMSSSDETVRPRPLSAAAINQTAPLPLKGSRSKISRTPPDTLIDEHDYADRGAQQPPQARILKRISLDQRSEHYEPSAYVDLPLGVNTLKTTSTAQRIGKEASQSTSTLRPTRPSAKSKHSSSSPSNSKASSKRSNSHGSSSQHSTHTNDDPDRPPCWAGSDFDFNGVLTDKEIAKLKKKGINPALYAEMQAAKKGGREGGSKGRKWIGPLVGNTYSG